MRARARTWPKRRRWPSWSPRDPRRIEVFGVIVIGYFAVLNLIYIAFTALAWRSITRYLHSLEYAAIDEALASPLTPPISILLPGYNEEAGIVQSVNALLQLRYRSSR